MSAASVGGVKLVSDEKTCTVGVEEVTTFQLASTAFTVTENDVPAVRADGELVLPVLEPASALSPGIKSCSFETVPRLTVIEGLVLEVLAPSVASEAVSVQVAGLRNVTLKLLVPETNAASV